MTSSVACSLCGSPRTHLLHPNCRSRRTALSGPFHLHRCRTCGAGFLSPRPAASLLASVYPDGYPSHREFSRRGGAWIQGLKALCLLPYMTRFGKEGFHLRPFGRGRLLDVGCGTGDFLRQASALGWSCTGCDVSETALRKARERVPGAKLLVGTLEPLTLPPSSFEVVTLWHTLEHLPHPLGTLREIHRLLAPEGKLVAAVPNLDSWEARILGSRWMEIDIPGHLFFFSPKSLRGLLLTAGFADVRLRPQVHPSSVSDALGFYLDDLTRAPRPRQRMWLYYALYPVTALSYAAGNWGCIEATAEKRL